ncbi:hypothetical protein PUNSTDRAFT_128324 [Punctularia strigosozonata HHB-11173 SS5]|uniref:Uncharacterized protein n=1 Tax=Punctularia strigosozonata (strain HHB-11173) TaxID=741275 RepID=R7S263_PUNST|nr:uncharacterized protein PUNSTDRAFT_128324 [Punctularia strigosozonata HHB-11173 SS5]EIN04495.1 hypothetical protein PUNSTDRAFT_128324 [Punctularia strigosozonata HHB-11173 SS5]
MHQHRRDISANFPVRLRAKCINTAETSAQTFRFDCEPYKCINTAETSAQTFRFDCEPYKCINTAETSAQTFRFDCEPYKCINTAETSAQTFRFDCEPHSRMLRNLTRTNKIRHLNHSVSMDCCPDEILLAIFSLACVDDGTTGRALSCVSRRVHYISAPVKYRSLAARGAAQINALTAHLAARGGGEPEQNVDDRVAPVPKVEHLLVSMIPPETRQTDEPKPGGPKGEKDDSRSEEGKGRVANLDVDWYRCFQLERKRQHEASVALPGLLALVAGTLRTLFADFWPTSDVALPSLPRLASLSLPSGEALQHLPPPLPSMTHLHLTTSPWVVNTGRGDENYLWVVIANSPMRATLSHLRLSGVNESSGNVPQFLRVLLDLPVHPEGAGKTPFGDGRDVRFAVIRGEHAHFAPGSECEQHARQTAANLPQLRNVWIEGKRHVQRGWCGTGRATHKLLFSGIEALVHQSQRRHDESKSGGSLMMLPIRDGDYGSEQLMADWLSYVGGGSGPWAEHTS